MFDNGVVMIGIEELIDEVRLFWHVLVEAGERLHEGESITMGMRAVLEYVDRNGPATVPKIARARRVTRQHIQALVSALLERKLVLAASNPGHRRSPLIQLAPKEKGTIVRIKRREEQF